MALSYLILQSYIVGLRAKLDWKDKELDSSEESNCLSWVGKGRTTCSQCIPGYFLFTLEKEFQLSEKTSLPAKSRVCVKWYNQAKSMIAPPRSTPQIRYFAWNASKIQPPGKTDKYGRELTRKCENELQKAPGGDTYILVKQNPQLLFNIKRRNYIKDEYFQVDQCIGCSRFCPERGVGCFQLYQNGLEYNKFNFISCSNSFYYDTKKQLCVSCPQNCQYCSNDTSCLVCANKYTAFTYKKRQNQSLEIVTECIKCMDGCDECYFGSKENLIDYFNDENNNLVEAEDTDQAAKQYDNKKPQPKLRCVKCEITSLGSYIPLLDLTGCKPCSSLLNCAQCEYTLKKSLGIPASDFFGVQWQQESLQSFQSFFPTKNNLVIEESEWHEYVLICTACQGGSAAFTLKLSRSGCNSCPENCKFCQSQLEAASVTPNTMELNFWQESIKSPHSDGYAKCLMCDEGYLLKSDGQCSIIESLSITNCAAYGSERQCQLCEEGFVLSHDQTKCQVIPEKNYRILNDLANCESYMYLGEQIYCQVCKPGYYLDFFRKDTTCVLCSPDESCKACYQTAQRLIYLQGYPETEKLKQDYAQYKEKNITVFSEERNKICTSCFKNGVINQNKCEMCGDLCSLDGCYLQSANPYCKKCKEGELVSTTDNRRNCIQCPKNCKQCTDSSLGKDWRKCVSCKEGYKLDNIANRCLECPGNKDCKKQFLADLKYTCQNLQQLHQDASNSGIVLDLLEELKKMESGIQDQLNEKAVSQIFIRLAIDTEGKNYCDLQTQTIFSFNPSEIPSIEVLAITLEASIQITFNVNRFIIFEYFNQVEIKNISFRSLKSSTKDNEKFGQPVGLAMRLNKPSTFSLSHSLIDQSISYDLNTPCAKKYEERNQFYFSFDLNNVYELNFMDVTFSRMSYNAQGFQMRFLKMQIADPVPYFSANLTQVTFDDIYLENQYVIEIEDIDLTSPLETSISIVFSKLQVRGSCFMNNSGLVKQNSDSVVSTFQLVDAKLSQNEILGQEGLIYLKGALEAKFEDVKVENCNFTNARLFQSNAIKASKFEITNSVFEKASVLFKTPTAVFDLMCKYMNCKEQTFAFSNFKFLKNHCANPQCFFDISSPIQEFPVSEVSFSGCEIHDTNSENFPIIAREAAFNSMITVSNVISLQVEELRSRNTYNISVFYTNAVSSVSLTHSSCETGELYESGNFFFVDNLGLSGKVEILDITLQSVKTRDNSIITISSYKPEVLHTNKESIKLTEIRVLDCKIMQEKINVPSSSILIRSEQFADIIITNLNFLNNRQDFINTPNSNSNPSLIVETPFGNVNISKSSFSNTQSEGQGAALIIVSNQTSLSRLIMLRSNSIMLKLNDKRSSDGGHFSVSAVKLTIQDSVFEHSKAANGGCGSITLFGSSELIIENVTIKNSEAAIDSTANNKGGALYITSLNMLNVIISDLTVYNVKARNEGGFAYISCAKCTQQSLVRIKGFEGFNIFSLVGGLVYASFPENSNQTQTLQIETGKVNQGSQESIEFVSQLNSLNLMEKLNFLERTGLVFLNLGSLVMEGVTLKGGIFGLLQAEMLSELNLNNVRLLDITFIVHSLIRIQNPRLYNSDDAIQIQNLVIQKVGPLSQSDHSQYQPLLSVIYEFQETYNYTGMVTIEGVSNKNKVKLTSITFNNVNNTESFCGLVCIIGVDPSSDVVVLNSIECSISFTGYLGCVAVIQSSLQDVVRQLPRISNLNQTYNHSSDRSSNQASAPAQLRALQESPSEDCPDDEEPVKIVQLHVYDCKGKYGTGVFVYLLRASVSDSNLVNNQAYEGAGVYLYGDHVIRTCPRATLTLRSLIEIRDNICEQNGCGIKILRSTFSKLDNSSVEIKSNQMQITYNKTMYLRPANIDDGPGAMVLIENQRIKNIPKLLVYSGLPVGYLQRDKVLIDYQSKDEEYYNQTDALNLTITLDERYNTVCNMRDQLEIPYDIEKGTYDISSLAVKCQEGINKVNIQARSNAILQAEYHEKIPFRVKQIKPIDYVLNITLSVSKCQHGWAFEKDSGNYGTCKKCERGYYVIPGAKNQTCHKQTELMLEAEGVLITTRNDTQRWKEDVIERCPPLDFRHANLEAKRCLSTQGVKSAACFKGYIGPLCVDCDYFSQTQKERYCRIGGICKPCQEKPENLFAAQLVLCVIIFIVVLNSQERAFLLVKIRLESIIRALWCNQKLKRSKLNNQLSKLENNMKKVQAYMNKNNLVNAEMNENEQENKNSEFPKLTAENDFDTLDRKIKEFLQSKTKELDDFLKQAIVKPLEERIEKLKNPKSLKPDDLIEYQKWEEFLNKHKHKPKHVLQGWVQFQSENIQKVEEWLEEAKQKLKKDFENLGKHIGNVDDMKSKQGRSYESCKTFLEGNQNEFKDFNLDQLYQDDIQNINKKLDKYYEDEKKKFKGLRDKFQNYQKYPNQIPHKSVKISPSQTISQFMEQFKEYLQDKDFNEIEQIIELNQINDKLEGIKQKFSNQYSFHKYEKRQNKLSEILAFLKKQKNLLNQQFSLQLKEIERKNFIVQSLENESLHTAWKQLVFFSQIIGLLSINVQFNITQEFSDYLNFVFMPAIFIKTAWQNSLSPEDNAQESHQIALLSTVLLMGGIIFLAAVLLIIFNKLKMNWLCCFEKKDENCFQLSPESQKKFFISFCKDYVGSKKVMVEICYLTLELYFPSFIYYALIQMKPFTSSHFGQTFMHIHPSVVFSPDIFVMGLILLVFVAMIYLAIYCLIIRYTQHEKNLLLRNIFCDIYCFGFYSNFKHSMPFIKSEIAKYVYYVTLIILIWIQSLESEEVKIKLTMVFLLLFSVSEIGIIFRIYKSGETHQKSILYVELIFYFFFLIGVCFLQLDKLEFWQYGQGIIIFSYCITIFSIILIYIVQFWHVRSENYLKTFNINIDKLREALGEIAEEGDQ